MTRDWDCFRGFRVDSVVFVLVHVETSLWNGTGVLGF